jgi:hypothetical protein
LLGIWIGAVTFTGSVIAYGKLAGTSVPFKVDTAAKKLPGGHMLNAAAAALSLVLLISIWGPGGLGAGPADAAGLLHRLSPDHGDRRRRHAGGGVDAEQLFGLGGGGDRLLARQ